MDLVLIGLQWSSCLVYLDDVIILGHNFDSHLLNLEEVFKRIQHAGLKIKLSKCKFMKHSVTYLGHVVSRSGIATDPDKVNKVVSWPVPTSCKELQAFLGLASYYRRFIKDFSSICRPLHHLTEKNVPFKWTPQCQSAFESIRSKLVSSPILVFPDMSKPFILDTDASDFGIGGVLSQIQDNGQEKVVAYASKALTKAEKQYSVTRRELLAVVTFTAHFRQYLLGNSFTIRTDHGSLAWLRNFKQPTGQLARWLEKLEEYSFTVEHRPGRKHNNADSLSRRPDEVKINTLDTIDNTLIGMSHDELRNLQLQDNTIKPVLLAKEKSNEQPSSNDTAGLSLHSRRLFQMWNQLVTRNGLLYRLFQDTEHNLVYEQLIVPYCLQKEILKEIHEGDTGGHLGQDKTLKKLKMRFYWPGHYNDVRDWCNTCPSCATRKTPAPQARAPLHNIKSGSPMQLLAVDIIGPFPQSHNNNKYILVAMDHFTKWAEAYPIPNQEAPTVANRLINNFFFRFSPPEIIHSDQGRQFESTLVKEICQLLQIKKTRTSPYHPQCDGLVERFNRTLLHMLSTSTKSNPLNWEEYVRPVCFAYNTSVHSSTGYTPFFLMFGREARLPVDLSFSTVTTNKSTPTAYVKQLQQTMEYAYNLVRDTVGKVQRRQKTLYDRNVHGTPFQEGEQVWLHSSVTPSHSCRKLNHPWTGPYRIITKLSDVTYKISPLHDKKSTL
jgi:hypothetical protein